MLFFQCIDLSAGNLEKAFERLEIYDYFNARELFLKSMKKEPAAASFGLSKIHISADNPFYNLDSASIYILKTDSTFIQLSDKQKSKYLLLGISQESINQLKDSICTKAFLSAEKSSSVDQLNHYLAKFSFCGSQEQAEEIRNSIAFQEARTLNTAAAYKSFLEKYPKSDEFKDAQNRYYERVFEEETASQQLGAYERFISMYPESPYKNAGGKNDLHSGNITRKYFRTQGIHSPISC